MLLYAGMWVAAWRIVDTERRPALHWLGYSLLSAAGLELISMRPGGNPWLTVALSNLLLTGATMLLARGGARFLGLRPHDREDLLVLLLLTMVMVWLGPQPQDGVAWRHPGFVTAGAVAWVLSRTAWLQRAALREQFGSRTAAVVSGTLAAFALLQWARSIYGLSSASAPPMNSAHAANAMLVYATLVTVAVLNFIYLFLMVLRLTGRLTHLVEHDVLTGLLNRRAMQHELAIHWDLWRQRQEPFAVVSVDLDHFKQINDRWGHGAGDEVLRVTAGRLSAAARSATDRVGRMGGEEFLVLLPGCLAEASSPAAERLRRALEASAVALPGGDTIRVTASLGVAAIRAGDRTPEEILQRADAALYAAKRAGRNRVAGPGDAVNAAPTDAFSGAQNPVAETRR